MKEKTKRNIRAILWGVMAFLAIGAVISFLGGDNTQGAIGIAWIIIIWLILEKISKKKNGEEK